MALVCSKEILEVVDASGECVGLSDLGPRERLVLVCSVLVALESRTFRNYYRSLSNRSHVFCIALGRALDSKLNYVQIPLEDRVRFGFLGRFCRKNPGLMKRGWFFDLVDGVNHEVRDIVKRGHEGESVAFVRYLVDMVKKC